MDLEFENLLLEWPLKTIKDVDLATIIPESAARRYALVNRALKKGILISLRRGLYLIGKPFRKDLPNNFEIAHSIYGPSYISFESALSFHQWIPEAVYQVRCATAKRSKEFNTPLGVFQYVHVPDRACYLGVQRVGSDYESIFIAEPWKAVADHYYAYNRKWNHFEDLYLDMRIEREDMLESDLTTLKVLSENYQSNRVRKFLSKILRSLADGNKND